MSETSKEVALAPELSALDAKIQESLIAQGDLAALTPAQKVQYYVGLCNSLGLNPFSQPFMYITLNGKLTLYARATACEQFRKMYNLNCTILERKATPDFMTVHVRVQSPTGRAEEAIGVVSISGLKGDAMANALMKAETKAKRRATLAFCGLGFMDESEIETVKGAKHHSAAEMHDSLPQPTADAAKENK